MDHHSLESVALAGRFLFVYLFYLAICDHQRVLLFTSQLLHFPYLTTGLQVLFKESLA